MSDAATEAAKPKKVTVDGQTVERRAVSETVEADQHDAANTAAASRRRGLLLNKFRPPGSI